MGRRRWALWCVATGVMLALVALAGCGASLPNGSNSSTGQPAHSTNGNGQTSFGPAATAATGQSSTPGPQYLIKALTVSMLFSDTRKVASDLQTWVASADPQSTSAGMDYQQV